MFERYIAYGWSNSLQRVVPRYVGVGREDRHKHCLDKKSHNVLVESHKVDSRWYVDVLSPVENECDAFSWEIETIAKYGRVDTKTGTLFNMTDGGEGVRGSDKSYMKTDEYRKNMKKIKTGTAAGEKNPMFGTHTNLGKTLGPNPAISKWHTDLWANMSDDERERRASQIRGKNNPMYGKAPANAHPVTINGIRYKSKTFALKSLREQGMSRKEAIILINGLGE